MNLDFYIIINLFIQLASSSRLMIFRDEPKLSNISDIYPQHKSRRLMCISDRPRDAIVWNSELLWSDNFLERDERDEMKGSEFSKFSINDEDLCKLGVDKECLSSWTQQGGTWKTVNSFDFPMGPVFDSRWENFTNLKYTETFKLITITKNGISSNFKMNGIGSFAFSIRGSSGVELLICSNNLNDLCRWIKIGDVKDVMGVMKRCQYGIISISRNECSPAISNNYNPLSSSEWTTFVLKWENHKGLALFNPHIRLFEYIFNDYQTLQIYYKNQDGSMFRLHDYSYTLTKDRGAVLKKSLLILENSKELCIDMLVGLCKHCELIVNIIDGSGKKRVVKKYRRLQNDGVEHDLPIWQNKRIQESNISDYPAPITLELVASVSSGQNYKTEDHWAITKFEHCLPEKTTKIVKMRAFQDCNTTGCFWNPVTCQRLSYDDPKSEVVDALNNSLTDLNKFENCPDYNIGPNCQIKCNSFFRDNCYGVEVCTESGCSCVQGWQGASCSTECPSGTYGFRCLKKCSNCTNDVCDSYSGKCYKGCKPTLQKVHVPPYCNIVIESPLPPIVDELDDTNARVCIYDEEVYKIINATYEFEIETKTGEILVKDGAQDTMTTNNGTQKQIYCATFHLLIPGTKYLVKAIIRIHLEDNQFKEIIGSSTTMITHCNTNQPFKIQPREKSFLIVKTPEVINYCPDSRFSVDLSMISKIRNRSYEINISNVETAFPFTLSELRPFTEYKVCIYDRDQKSKICQLSSTLESAPSPVTNLQVKSITTTEAQITWSSPDSPNGIIKNYKLMIEVLYYLDCENAENTPKDLKITKVYSTTELSCNLTNLVPYVSYQVTIIAFNSQMGNKSSLVFSTKSPDIPAEVFTNIRYSHNNLTWDNPANCWTITGLIEGSRIMITGVSANVPNFIYSYDTKERFLNLETVLNGNEMYHAQVYVLHKLGGLINATAYVNIFFSTDPSSPPEVQNLQIVEVDESTTTLRWQSPLPPTNGELDYYDIQFLLENGTLLYEIMVYPNETCYLWKNSICKTVFHPYSGIKQYINISAYNKGVSEPGESVRIDDNHEEQIPEKAEIISITEIDKGVLYLKWQHPSITGGPMKNFLIHSQRLETDLEHLSDENSHKTIVFPIHKYQPEYSTYLYLLPSTLYRISIQGEVSGRKGILSAKTVVTKSAVNFQYEPHPVLTDDFLSINIVIPPVINNTKNSQLYIIVKGPSICKQRERLSDSLMKDIRVDDHDAAWRIATFLTHETANLSFTIGDDHISDTVSNCSLEADNSYIIVLLVREGINLVTNETSQLLIWQSEPIMVGETKVHHELWVIPLILIFLVIGGTTYYCLRTRRYQKYFIGKRGDEPTESISIHESTVTENNDSKSRNLNKEESVLKSLLNSQECTYETISVKSMSDDLPNTRGTEGFFLNFSSNSTEHTNLNMLSELKYENLQSKTTLDDQSQKEQKS